MKTRPITDAQEAPCDMSLSALIKSVKEIVLFAINSMQFAEFIFHIWYHFTFSHSTSTIKTLSNRRLECKGKWTGFNLILSTSIDENDNWNGEGGLGNWIGNSLNSGTRSLICWQWDISSLER